VSLSPTKYNVLLVWPHKVQLVQKSWLLNTALDIKETYLVDEKEGSKHTLDALKNIIERLDKWRPVTVVLFGNKVRYRLLEHHAQLSPGEFLALAEHQFKQIFGNKAFEWQYFSQVIRHRRKNLTAALDSHWLDSIQLLLIESNIKFYKIQSAATWLFNDCRKSFGENKWIILRADSEVFIFKLNEHEIDHFKHDTLKHALTIENVLRREVLAVGEEPEKVNHKLYDLNEIVNSQQIVGQVAMSADHLTRQNT
jgi:hypothetical protein